MSEHSTSYVTQCYTHSYITAFYSEHPNVGSATLPDWVCLILWHRFSQCRQFLSLSDKPYRPGVPPVQVCAVWWHAVFLSVFRWPPKKEGHHIYSILILQGICKASRSRLECHQPHAWCGCCCPLFPRWWQRPHSPVLLGMCPLALGTSVYQHSHNPHFPASTHLKHIFSSKTMHNGILTGWDKWQIINEYILFPSWYEICNLFPHSTECVYQNHTFGKHICDAHAVIQG